MTYCINHLKPFTCSMILENCQTDHKRRRRVVTALLLKYFALLKSSGPFFLKSRPFFVRLAVFCKIQHVQYFSSAEDSFINVRPILFVLKPRVLQKASLREGAGKISGRKLWEPHHSHSLYSLLIGITTIIFRNL